jgi:N-acetylmuramoyl-L-alanine amidase
MHIPHLMRALVATMLLAVFVLVDEPASVLASPGKPQTVVLFGRNHVRLADWARANGYETHWLKKDESVQLTKGAGRLVFTIDSRDAEVNGVNVFLSHPIVAASGSLSISEMDLQTSITPILTPPKNWSGAKVKKIVVDPGHGGSDPGFRDGSREEKKYTLLLAEELCNQLKEAGFDASLTRTTDTKIELQARPEIANRRGADLFISLHWNSAGSARNEVRGVETYCLTPAGASSTNAGGEVLNSGTKPGNRYNEKNLFLAYQIHKSLLAGLAIDDRGVKRARFAVLRTAEMPSVLIEGGFMSHPTESKHIYDSMYRKQMAKAIVTGIAAYKKQVEQIKAK